MTSLSPTLHVLLVAAVVHQYRLESQGVVWVLVLAALGLPVQARLGLVGRAWFFLGLSLAGLVLVLGPWAAGMVLGVGLVLVGLCHLPLGWGWRVGLLVAVGAGLSWGRWVWAGLGPVWLQAVWPILGSMFLFRLALYVYELRTRPAEWPGWGVTLGYCFMLPNVVFPLFPVVDFRRFHKGRGRESDEVLGERGSRWVVRGLWHLLLYRLVYQHGVLDPLTVEGSGELLAYMLSSFLLYLRVSGQFHLVVGLLLLFGFSLPATHQRYFLARSLTDFWRRINIYWKDFMTKMVFFPAHGRLRRAWGERWALVLATAAVFVATWALHALQWLLLTGRGLFAWHDGLFWGILGALVVINVVLEDRWGRRRQLGRPGWVRQTGIALRTLATFLVLMVLWSLWTTEDVALWWHLWGTAPGLAPGLLLAVALLLVLSWWLERRLAEASAPSGTRSVPRPEKRVAPLAASLENRVAPLVPRILGRLAALVLLLVLGLPSVHGRLAEPVARLAETLRASGPNARDAAELRRGYYEELLAVGSENPGLHASYRKAPADWRRIHETNAWRPRSVEGRPLPTPGGELVPGARIDFKRARLTVNAHGMRDRERAVVKAPGVGRLALLGSSHAMGSGVADDETFAARLERRWNHERSDASAGTTVEVLNFAVAGHSVLDTVTRLELDVLAFAPDAVLVVGHTHDAAKIVRVVARHLAAGGTFVEGSAGDTTVRALAGLARSVAAAPGQPVSVLEHRLRPRRFELLELLYRRMAATCHERGIVPVWVLLPLLSGEDAETAERMLELTDEAGFEVLDLRGVYTGLDPADLRLAPWDEHPDAGAHRRIAERLDKRLRAASWARRLGLPAPPSQEGGARPTTAGSHPGG